jgi:hypothetical protein
MDAFESFHPVAAGWASRAVSCRLVPSRAVSCQKATYFQLRFNFLCDAAQSRRYKLMRL